MRAQQNLQTLAALVGATAVIVMLLTRQSSFGLLDYFFQAVN